MRLLGSRRTTTRVAAVAVAVCCALGSSPASAAPVDSWPSDTAGGTSSSYNPGESVITAANAPRARLAWSVSGNGGPLGAPTVVGGQVFRVIDTSVAGPPSTFEVRSARTGALLWQISLPGNAFYEQGVTVDAARSLAIVSFQGFGRPPGVLAVDLVRKRIAWTRDLPARRYSWSGNDVYGAGPVVSDGTRIFVAGADNAVNAFRLSDGARLWTVPLALRAERLLHQWYGTATSGGVVYVGTSQGLGAYDAVSGRRLWSAPAAGRPMVAGGRVFVARAGGVTAVNAAGCGASTCPVLWNRELGPSKTWPPGADGRAPRIGAASATTLYATYFDYGDGMTQRGVLVRLSASTGAVLWSASTLEDPGTPARGGDTVWLIANPGPDGTGVRSVVGYSASARGTAPLFRYEMPVGQRGFYGGIAISGGTVVVQNSAGPLRGFRIPGT